MKVLVVVLFVVVALVLASSPVPSEAQALDPCGSCVSWCGIRYRDDPYLYCSCMKGCARNYCSGEEIDLPPGCSLE